MVGVNVGALGIGRLPFHSDKPNYRPICGSFKGVADYF